MLKAKAYSLALMLALMLGITEGTSAGPFEDGLNAYQRRDFATAYALLLPLAHEGNSIAQTRIGLMYRNGDGVQQDNFEAMNWYRRAAQTGNGDARHHLAEMYYNGRGVPRDYTRAYMWFTLRLAEPLSILEREFVEEYRKKAASRMASAEIALALEMAASCRASNYQQCGESTRTATTTPSSPASPQRSPGSNNASVIPLQKKGGTYTVRVLINNAITLTFILDSGASDASIPADVVMTLIRTGTLKETDFLEKKTYVLADGSKLPSQTFRIQSMRVGDRVVLNVTGSVAPVEGSLLLGQSFLGRFKSWSIDNSKGVLSVTARPHHSTERPGLRIIVGGVVLDTLIASLLDARSMRT